MDVDTIFSIVVGLVVLAVIVGGIWVIRRLGLVPDMDEMMDEPVQPS